MLDAYSEIRDSSSSLMERLVEVNQARIVPDNISLSTENRIHVLTSVESSLIDTMKRLNEVATPAVSSS